jgi:hypothetical protein
VYKRYKDSAKHYSNLWQCDQQHHVNIRSVSDSAKTVSALSESIGTGGAIPDSNSALSEIALGEH